MFYLCLIEKMRSYIMQQQDEAEYIDVYGARVHNLKNIDAHIPRGSLTTRFLPKASGVTLRPSLPMRATFWVTWSVPM